MWLSGLHIPESYLTALVQTTCRKYKWALDRSTLYTTVTRHRSRSEVPNRLADGCYIEGLYLEGASWNHDRSCLQRQKPKVLVEELPVIQIIPVEISKLKLVNTFRAPVYVTQARRSAAGVGLVFEADLTSFEHSSHWVRTRVFLLFFYFFLLSDFLLYFVFPPLFFFFFLCADSTRRGTVSEHHLRTRRARP